MRLIFLFLLVATVLLSACNSRQVKDANSKVDTKVHIISYCDASCEQAIFDKYGIQKSTFSERLVLGTGKGVVNTTPTKVIFVDGKKDKYNSFWNNGEVDITLDPGWHEIMITQDFGMYETIIFARDFAPGTYAFSTYIASFGWSACWVPFVYDYTEDKLLLPESDALTWHEGFPTLTNMGAIKLQLSGDEYKPGQCERMPEIMERNKKIIRESNKAKEKSD